MAFVIFVLFTRQFHELTHKSEKKGNKFLGKWRKLVGILSESAIFNTQYLVKSINL